ncbi:class I tRNA ligase family protein, partial [Candidatus Kaiserbacteria bacterium]|nr:class I tRNA ligase family protein [Candidatus Kaiserbacteria bacterium]
PAHDERDFAFARKFSIKIKQVVTNLYMSDATEFQDDLPYTDKVGVVVSSNEFTGLDCEEAKQKIVAKVGGRITSTYKIKDWVFSRQRYWGEPIPVVHAENGKIYPLAESQLPLTLPEVEQYAPSGNGQSPLSNIPDWVNVTGYVNETGDFIVASEAREGFDLIKAKRET